MISLPTRTNWYWAAAYMLRRDRERMADIAARVLKNVAAKSQGRLRDRALETLQEVEDEPVS